MAISTCKRCEAPYWRYRRDHPPPSFCSLGCKETYALDHPKKESAPDEPHIIIRRIKDHNRLFHNAESVMIDWDCKPREKLQAEYAESLSFHQQFAPEPA